MFLNKRKVNILVYNEYNKTVTVEFTDGTTNENVGIESIKPRSAVMNRVAELQRDNNPDQNKMRIFHQSTLAGDLKPFYHPVDDVVESQKILAALARYDRYLSSGLGGMNSQGVQVHDSESDEWVDVADADGENLAPK